MGKHKLCEVGYFRGGSFRFVFWSRERWESRVSTQLRVYIRRALTQSNSFPAASSFRIFSKAIYISTEERKIIFYSGTNTTRLKYFWSERASKKPPDNIHEIVFVLKLSIRSAATRESFPCWSRWCAEEDDGFLLPFLSIDCGQRRKGRKLIIQ